MSASYLVLTPGATGADGISEASRLIVRALCADRPDAVHVVSMGDPAGAARAEGGARIHGAGGCKPRFVAAALRAGLRGPRGAHVVCLHAHLSPVARLLAGRRRPLTCVLYGIEAWRPMRRLARLALGRARLIAISEHTLRRFAAAHPDLAARPSRVCHLGIGEPPPDPLPPGDGGFALIVGRMAAGERYKGHDLLLDLWPRVLREVPGARLVVAGDGDDRARLEARAAPLGASVRFEGRVSRPGLADLYARAAFFAMPSREEGFGLVYLEAMRAGRACIGGVGAAAEIIEDGVSGLVVDPGAPEQVLGAVVRLFREPATRARMGRAGAERMAREFTEAAFRQRFRAAMGGEPGAA